MVHWLVPVVLKIIVNNGCAPFFTKQIVHLPDRAKRHFVVYLFCVLLSLLFVLAFGSLATLGFAPMIFSIGLLNGVGHYLYWRAMDISLSKSSLYLLWGDIVSMSLCYGVLGEGRFLTTGVTVGVLLSITSAIMFVRADYLRHQRSEQVRAAQSLRFYAFIGVSSTVFGVAAFLIRLWVTQEVPVQDFLFSWYTGCVISAALVYVGSKFFSYDNPSLVATRYTWADIFRIGLVSLSIAGSLSLIFWAYHAPQLVVQPIFMVASATVPALLGLFVFGEHKHLGRAEWVYFSVGMLGALTIAFSR